MQKFLIKKNFAEYGELVDGDWGGKADALSALCHHGMHAKFSFLSRKFPLPGYEPGTLVTVRSLSDALDHSATVTH